MNKATEFAKVLRGLARYSQCSESRAAFSQAAEVIDRLTRENMELRQAVHGDNDKEDSATPVGF